jgi:hypothetical protein
MKGGEQRGRKEERKRRRNKDWKEKELSLRNFWFHWGPCIDFQIYTL